MSIAVSPNINSLSSTRQVVAELLVKSRMETVMFSNGGGGGNQTSVLTDTIVADGSKRQSATATYRRGNNGAQRSNIY